MTEAEMSALAKAYFAALDARDLEALTGTLAEDVVFSVETHGVVYDGRAAILDVFAQRWQGSGSARHHTFTHTSSPDVGRIATQFVVTYSGAGAPAEKSNANVFAMSDGLITRIQVYMAGENTIRA